MMNGARYLMIGITLFFLTGCPSRRVAPTESQLLAPEADRELLRARAARLWQAKVVEDWESVFDLYDPQKRESYKATGVAEYGTEPVRILSFRVQDVVTENDLGWVWIEYQVTLLRYDNPAPVTMRASEKWRRVEGNWYLIPAREAIMYPESPDLRNRAEESTLRARFEKSWAARRRSDWARLYRMIDPRDRGDVIFDDFAHSEEEFRYLQYKVGWIEVIGDAGRVLVTHNRRLTDKNLEKMPPSDTTTIEYWTRINGVWYFDLK